jgi:hypothetical protein
MTQALHQSWHVGKVTGACAACNAALEPGLPCWAALCERRANATSAAPVEEKKKSKDKDKEPEVVSPFERVDFCEACWSAGKRPGPPPAGGAIREDLDMFSFWRTTVPQPQAKKKLLVDDSVLVDLFARMSERNEANEERFRFVLALILMRKRLLKYESTQQVGEGDAKKEVWTMFLRIGKSVEAMGGGSVWASEPSLVTNPHLTAEQISEVSQQLSSVLAEEI